MCVLPCCQKSLFGKGRGRQALLPLANLCWPSELQDKDVGIFWLHHGNELVPLLKPGSGTYRKPLRASWTHYFGGASLGITSCNSSAGSASSGRLPQDTIELTTRPRGQSSEEYWMLGSPWVLDAEVKGWNRAVSISEAATFVGRAGASRRWGRFTGAKFGVLYGFL